jgi:hypothetical protein
MTYFEEAQAIWERYVPERGQADTVQGELLRAVEKLRGEAQRNGNMNWDEGHEKLAAYLGSTLVESALFDEVVTAQIRTDLERLLDHEHPETDDAPYDRLEERVVDWARAHPDPVPHPHDPTLRR